MDGACNPTFAGWQVEVHDSIAWCIYKSIQNHSELMSQGTWSEVFEQLLQALTAGASHLAAGPACHVCDALHVLAEHVAELDTDEEELYRQRETLAGGMGSSTNQLSPMVARLLQALVETADRPDAGDQTNNRDLRSCAYDALDVVISRAAADCVPLMAEQCGVVTKKLQSTFTDNDHLNRQERLQLEKMQGHCCGVFMALASKLDRHQLEPLAQPMMACMLQLFDIKATRAYKVAFMAIGTLANYLKGSFIQYMPTFQGVLMEGLASTDKGVCYAAVRHIMAAHSSCVVVPHSNVPDPVAHACCRWE